MVHQKTYIAKTTVVDRRRTSAAATPWLAIGWNTELSTCESLRFPQVEPGCNRNKDLIPPKRGLYSWIIVLCTYECSISGTVPMWDETISFHCSHQLVTALQTHIMIHLSRKPQNCVQLISFLHKPLMLKSVCGAGQSAVQGSWRRHGKPR